MLRVVEPLDLSSSLGMAKRLRGSDEDRSSLKRRKVDRDEGGKKAAEEILSSQDLQQLLAFEQDTSSHVKHSMLPQLLHFAFTLTIGQEYKH